MKQNLSLEPSPFIVYRLTLKEQDRAALDGLLENYERHCLLSRMDAASLREDVERALLWYHSAGVPLEEAIARLSPIHLGGFYARPPVTWFPLDDAAKIYPLSMRPGKMAVFRLSIYLRQPVVPELLQMALTFTVKRFPSFATTVKSGFFWYYLDTAKTRFAVEPAGSIPCQPLDVSRSGSASFRVLYHDNRISVEFFHILTDGTGGIAETVRADLLRMRIVDADRERRFADPHNLEIDAVQPLEKPAPLVVDSGHDAGEDGGFRLPGTGAVERFADCGQIRQPAPDCVNGRNLASIPMADGGRRIADIDDDDGTGGINRSAVRKVRFGHS